jgi:hypothetical protein
MRLLRVTLIVFGLILVLMTGLMSASRWGVTDRPEWIVFNPYFNDSGIPFPEVACRILLGGGGLRHCYGDGFAPMPDPARVDAWMFPPRWSFHPAITLAAGFVCLAAGIINWRGGYARLRGHRPH